MNAVVWQPEWPESLSVKDWGLLVHPHVKSQKTILKRACEAGLNPTKEGGVWVVRKPENKNLERNLYFDGRYKYRNKKENTWHRFPSGTSEAQANEWARELNSHLDPMRDIVAEILGKPSFKSFAEEYLDRLDVKQSTKDLYTRQVKNIIKQFPVAIADIQRIHISDYIKSLTPAQGLHYRSRMVEIYKIAVAQGAVDINEAEKTLPPKLPEKSRPKLSQEQFWAIHKMAPLWLQVAMEIGLYSLQRQGDILNLKYEDIEDGQWKLIQEKTGAAIAVRIGENFAQSIRRSRDNTLSRFVVHKRNQRKNTTRVHYSTLQEKFRSLAKQVCGEEYPTFHEIRGLGIRMYRDQGIDPQLLAGHADSKMTDQYDGVVRYTEVGSL